jgi:uridine kinase
MPKKIEQSLSIVEKFIKENFPRGAVICVTGNGAAGKTVFANALADKLSGSVYPFDSLYLNVDARRKLIETSGKVITGCHPDAFDYALAISVLEKIRNRQAAPLYSNQSAKDGVTNYQQIGWFQSKPYVIIDGLSALQKDLEQFYDLVIFLYCDQDVEFKRRLTRDTNTSEFELEKIFKARRSQYELFIEPLKEKAQIILKSKLDFSLEIEKIP